ncbi:hypothetical protein VI26_15125 [Chromobacterium sp. LK1]|nr:hypothetical protein VI26_15125 [Chromobacterium sp. LK1]
MRSSGAARGRSRTKRLNSLLAKLIGHAGAFAAIGRHAKLAAQIAHAGGSVVHRFADLLVSYSMAQANVHGSSGGVMWRGIALK